MLVAVGLVGLALIVVSGKDRAEDRSESFAPAPGTPVAADTVRSDIESAIGSLAAAGYVEVDAVSFVGGQRFDLEIAVDATRRAMRSREAVTGVTAIGDPAGPNPIVSELTVIDENLYLRVLQPGQDPDTPFQRIAATHEAEDLLAGAFTNGGRIFDSLDVLAQVVRSVPFHAERLPPKKIDGVRAQGARATFDAALVAGFLHDRELEVVDGDGLDGSTVFEFWYSGGVLVELVATGVQFHDGEALRVAARVDYRVAVARPIDAPLRTVG